MFAEDKVWTRVPALRGTHALTQPTLKLPRALQIGEAYPAPAEQKHFLPVLYSRSGNFRRAHALALCLSESPLSCALVGFPEERATLFSQSPRFPWQMDDPFFSPIPGSGLLSGS